MTALRRSIIAVTTFHLIATTISVFAGETARAVIGVAFIALFLVGVGLFIAAFLVAANRSRHERVSVAGVFFLGDGSVSSRDRTLFLGCVAVQTVVAVIAAAVRPFTAVAFTVLVPMLGLGLAAWFGARYGEFSLTEPPAPGAEDPE